MTTTTAAVLIAQAAQPAALSPRPARVAPPPVRQAPTRGPQLERPGADCALVGSGNLETLEYSCVGLAEAAYDSIGKGVISGFEEALVSTPLEMYLGSIQRMSITVEAGDLVEIPIRGVVLHPDSPSLLTHGRGWYCSGNAYPCIGAVAETDINVTMGGNPPEAANFGDQGSKRYLFSWRTEGTDAGRTYYITFTLTTTPYVTTAFDNPEALPRQTEDQILSIEVVRCPVESACASPETDTAVTVGQNLEVTVEEVCGEMTARAIESLIHSPESVPQQPVANDHTTTTRTAAVTKEFTQGSADTTFNQSTFDCGDGPNGYTLCAEPLTPFPAGPALILMNVVAGDIPLNDPTNYYQYGFVFDADGDTSNNYQPSAAYPNDFFKDTDLWYVANYDPAGGVAQRDRGSQRHDCRSLLCGARHHQRQQHHPGLPDERVLGRRPRLSGHGVPAYGRLGHGRPVRLQRQYLARGGRRARDHAVVRRPQAVPAAPSQGGRPVRGGQLHRSGGRLMLRASIMQWIEVRSCYQTLALAGLLGFGPACGDDDDPIADLVQDCAADSGDEQCELFRLINTERQSAGVPLYDYHAALAQAAQLHANDMAENDYFDHASLDGRSFADRAHDAGYQGSPTGENIAQASDASRVIQMWMESTGHRENLLSTRSNEVGVGAQQGLWVAVFGAR